jgi:hypothetical protein
MQHAEDQDLESGRSSDNWKWRDKSLRREKWSKDEIVAFMTLHPDRAYFSRLFRDGGFRSGIEVGVAGGRFSEHFLTDNVDNRNWTWTMIEPFPNADFQKRYRGTATKEGSWKTSGIIKHVDLRFFEGKSMDYEVLHSLPAASYDFIYLDGDHEYKTVKEEIPVYWEKVAPGGVLAGHDYCNYGEPGSACHGCKHIPQCGVYTEYGVASGKRKGRVSNQNGVVKAVQEWLMRHPGLTLYHTIENFTESSLRMDNIDFTLIITGTRNPSWFVIKPQSQ